LDGNQWWKEEGERKKGKKGGEPEANVTFPTTKQAKN